MMDRRTRDRATTHTIAPMLVASFCLAACEAFVGSGPTSPYSNDMNPSATPPDNGAGSKSWSMPAGGSGAPNNTPAAGGSSSPAANKPRTNPPANPPSNPATNPPANPPANNPTNPPIALCDAAPAKAKATLTSYCSSCHSNPATAKAGFSTILNAVALVSSGKVVRNQPDMSPVFKRLSAGSMPPAEVMKRPGTDDIASIKDWIECGAEDWDAASNATAEFLSIDTRLRTVLDDVRSFGNPIDRERMRYLDFSALANSGVNSDQLQVIREATSMLLNSLSRGRTVVAPVAVDKNKLLYRIDLRDYLWDATTWNQLEEIYPYAVIYDQDSRLLPFDEVSSEQIRLETNTQIPIIQADWFISHASRPPLYHTLLNLPDNLDDLARQLGVDIQRNIDTEQVLRSGFANAGPSRNNRVIERHELGGNRGALWVSYDFATNLNDQNIFANPLDFREDGGEMIFNLENGLQGYFIAAANGQRLDKAPSNVVQDPQSRDGAVENGLSCMNCHQNDGQLPKYDEIRDFQLSAGANAAEIEQVLALYVPRAELQRAFDADQNRYRTARSALGITKVTNTAMHELDDTHLGIVDINMVAAVLGLRANDLKRAIDASPQAFPPEIVTLRTQGGGIQRDSFESVIRDLIEALGLGRQLRANDIDGSSNNNNNQAPVAGSGSSPDAGPRDSSSGGSSGRR